MSKIHRTAIAMALLIPSAQAITAQIIKGPNNGRVAGLAVSILDQVVNGAGKDVDIQVDMTTVQTEFGPPSVMRGVPLFLAFTEDEFETNRSGFGGLGDAILQSSRSASDTQGRTFTNFYYNPGPFNVRGTAGTYSGNALEVTFRRSNFTEGELPALDYGDGETVDVETLSPFGSPTTTTVGPIRTVRNRWRGTFTHTYADLGSYTVTAASRCCPRRPLGDDDEMVGRGFGYDVSPGYVVAPNSPSQLQFSFNSYERLQFTNATETGGQLNRGIPIDGTFINDFGTDGTGVKGGAQVTNTALVEEGLGAAFAAPIPGAGSFGLALLSLLLAAAGFFTLRR